MDLVLYVINFGHLDGTVRRRLQPTPEEIAGHMSETKVRTVCSEVQLVVG